MSVILICTGCHCKPAGRLCELLSANNCRKIVSDRYIIRYAKEVKSIEVTAHFPQFYSLFRLSNGLIIKKEWSCKSVMLDFFRHTSLFKGVSLVYNGIKGKV